MISLAFICGLFLESEFPLTLSLTLFKAIGNCTLLSKCVMFNTGADGLLATDLRKQNTTDFIVRNQNQSEIAIIANRIKLGGARIIHTLSNWFV